MALFAIGGHGSGDHPDRGGLVRPAATVLWTLVAALAVTACESEQAPVACGSIPQVELHVGEARGVEACFTDANEDVLVYSVTVADPSVALVANVGASVTVTGVSPGGTTATVTAADPVGLEGQEAFEVLVPNRVPEARGAFSDRVLDVGGGATVDVASRFAEPDGEELSYAVASEDAGVAEAALAGSVLTVTARAKGSVAVTVTARDPGGLEAAQGFVVTVRNRAPVAVGTIADRTIEVGEAVEVGLAGYFSDPDGDPLGYEAVSSGAGVAVSVSLGVLTVRAVAKGTARVTVTATDDEGLSALQLFGVTVPNRVPVAVGEIAEQSPFAGEAVVLDASDYFSDPDGDELRYGASTSDRSVATAAVSGAVLTVRGVSPGGTRVTVTATDDEGLSATQSFAARVPNRAPVAVGAVPDATVEAGAFVVVAAAQYFSEPDGEVLAYAALTSDNGVATVTVAGPSVKVTGRGKGVATVTVTARDPGGLGAEQAFAVTVPNRAPVAVGEIGGRRAFVGGQVSVNLYGYFSDPDRDPLEYAAISAGGGVEVEIDGIVLRATAVAKGEAEVTVTATDTDGLSAGQSFVVTVPNRVPETFGEIADRTLAVGDAAEVELGRFFSDPDGDALTYAAVSSGSGEVELAVSGSALLVVAVAKGEAEVAVTATDDEGLSAGQSFVVTVPNRSPVATAGIPDVTVEVDAAAEIDLSEHFSDPDGDVLTYAAVSSDAGEVELSVSGSTLRVVAVAKGEAEVAVTATDDEGLSAEQVFVVTVPNRSPVATAGVPDETVEVAAAVEIDLSGHFADPDGDVLTYAAVSSGSGEVELSVSGSTLRVVAVAKGEAEVTVTATDDGGLSAGQGFVVTVPNRAPVATAGIPDETVEVDAAAEIDLSGHFSDPDGDVLAFGAVSSDAGVATATVLDGILRVVAVAKGEAEVTVTATDDEGLSAEQSFAVTVPNRVPVATGAIPSLTVEAGGEVDALVGRFFSDPDGDALTFSAQSSDASVATASVSGSIVTVAGVARGSATITVTASDGELSAASSFAVTVGSRNRAPVVSRELADQAIAGGGSVEIDVSGNFSDPDGDALTFSASSSDTDVATASVSGSTVTVAGVADGSATVTVTASDGELSVADAFTVTVGSRNRAPVVAREIADLAIVGGGSVRIDVSGNFSDPDGDALTFSASSSDTDVATASVSGSTVTVAGVADGSATVTVTASDGELSVADAFTTVVGNRAPVVASEIPDQGVLIGGSVDIDASGHFSDPDGDALSYTAQSSDTDVATASVSGNTLTIAGVSSGRATVTVTASDGELSVADAFTTVVGNRPPVTTGDISDQAVAAGGSVDIDVSGNFSDPDGDPLTFSAASSDTDVATASASGSTVTVAGVARGRATVTVTASDGELSVANAFTATVANRPPTLVGAIPDQSVTPGGNANIDLSAHFSDPDGDALSYTAVSADVNVATANVSGSTLTVDGVARGNAEITVTASDGELSATNTLTVTVGNRAPTVSTEIPDSAIGRAGAQASFDVSANFTDPDGDPLTYTAVSSDLNVATVAVSGSTVTVTAVADGSATITVTASDGELSVADAFAATVGNRAPRVSTEIPDSAIGGVGSTASIDLSGHFADSDGDAITYTAVSSDLNVATVAVSASTVTITAVAGGTATVTVTASDGSLSVEATFDVTVGNRAPTVSTEIADVSLGTAGETATITASDHFSDPDGDAITYTAVSSDTDVATVAVSASTVTITAVAGGTATITATASDGSLSVSDAFDVTVTVPNRAPTVTTEIADQGLRLGGRVTIDISANFSDPDGDALSYTVRSSDARVATASVSASTVTIAGVARGEATITVTASDGELSTSDAFRAAVGNQAPVVSTAIADRAIGRSGAVDTAFLGDHFADPDGDDLTYTATSLNPGLATATIPASPGDTVVVLTAVANGNATITVTASDGELSVTETFTARVGDRKPELYNPIADFAIGRVGNTRTINLLNHFRDPDGDNITRWSQGLEDSDIVDLEYVHPDQFKFKAEGDGSAWVRMRAGNRDPGGNEVYSAWDTVTVTVGNRVPVLSLAFADSAIGKTDNVTKFPLLDHFSDADGDVFTYTVESDKETVATVSEANDTLSVTAKADGTATITVKVEDGNGGEVEDAFDVTAGNRAPMVTSEIPDAASGRPGLTVVIEGGDHFSEPDGDALTYAAVSSDASLVTVVVSGSTITVTGVADGNPTITVTAEDDDTAPLSASDAFVVAVANRAPVYATDFADQTIDSGTASISVDVAGNFSDADGDALTYTPTSSNDNKATVSVSGSTVTVTGHARGSVTITVTASDGDATASGSFATTILGNRPPEVKNAITDKTVDAFASIDVDISGVFSDVDGDDLTYSVASLDTFVATASLSGTTVTVDGVYDGSAKIVVTASDGVADPARDTFAVAVDGLTDKEVLVKIYDEMGGDTWRRKLNWKSALRIGRWSGVTTEEHGGVRRVISIRLNNNGLDNSIPEEVDHMTLLKELWMDENDDITGSIPSEVGNLGNLESLHLHETGISGSIPSELGDLSNLTRLRLNDTDISGSIPSELGDLDKVTYLDLSDTDISGSIPPELGDMSKLRYFYLYNTDLSGSLPSELGDLGDLLRLRLNDTDLTGAMPSSFTDLDKVNTLNTENTDLCAPTDQDFQDWLDGIRTVTGVVDCTD